jgi:hypothetical protein
VTASNLKGKLKPTEDVIIQKQFLWLTNYSRLTHSWSWALLEKLPLVQLFKNLPAFYGTRRFIAVFTRALRC